MKGEFVCIVGDVGSGKTSLMNAIIGEMISVWVKDLSKYESIEDMIYLSNVSSSVLINGSIAFTT